MRIGDYDVRLVFLNRLGELDPEHGRLWRTDARYHADTDAVAHLVAEVVGILMTRCKVDEPSVHFTLIDELAQRCADGRQAQEAARRLAESVPITLPPEFDKPDYLG